MLTPQAATSREVTFRQADISLRASTILARATSQPARPAWSSSRSSRALSGGIRYLAPGDSIWEFARHPSRLATALSMAKQAMATRSQFVNATPERARRLTFCCPIYKGDPYKPWQVRLAFKLLEMLGPGDIPVDYELVPGAAATKLPLVKWLRNPENLIAAGLCRE